MCTVNLLNLRIIDSQKTLKVSFNKCRLWVFLDCTYYKEHMISSAWLFPRECFWVLRERLEIKENP